MVSCETSPSLKALAKVRSNLKGKDRNNDKNSKLLLLIETRPLSSVTRIKGKNLSKKPHSKFLVCRNQDVSSPNTVKNILTYSNYFEPTETRNNLDSEYRQNSGQNLLSVDKFHYLNVPQIDIITPYDDFECILICLHHPLCVSVNFAAKEKSGVRYCPVTSSTTPTNSKKARVRITIRFQMHHYKFSEC